MAWLQQWVDRNRSRSLVPNSLAPRQPLPNPARLGHHRCCKESLGGALVCPEGPMILIGDDNCESVRRPIFYRVRGSPDTLLHFEIGRFLVQTETKPKWTGLEDRFGDTEFIRDDG